MMDQSTEVAIVGMSCEFPGAPDLEAFRELLRRGESAVAEPSTERRGHRLGGEGEPWFAAGYLERFDRFDPEYFGLSTRDANALCPQQRLLLEHTCRALTSAGQPFVELNSVRTGVFVSQGASGYPLLRRERAPMSEAVGSLASMAAGRISRFLGLRGPSLCVDTGCSASLHGLALARQFLVLGEIDIAIVGAVSLLWDPRLPEASGIIASDGVCRPFDERASGTVGGEGIGVVALRRLGDAVQRREPILAVLESVALDHEGALASSLTAPSVVAQTEVIQRALRAAGVGVTEVGYVEAHGTGTKVGDPIEIRALQRVFDGTGTSVAAGSQVRISAVKANLGHLNEAAGMAGLIKAVLALRNRELYPIPGIREPSSLLGLAGSRLELQRRTEVWETNDQVRRAGVSSFSFSGANAHAVLREYCAGEPERRHPGTPVVLKISAASQGALRANAEVAMSWLERDGASVWDDCWTLNRGRDDLSHRAMLVGTIADIGDGLRKWCLQGDAVVPTQQRPVFALVGSTEEDWWSDAGDLGQGRRLRELGFDDATTHRRSTAQLRGWFDDVVMLRVLECAGFDVETVISTGRGRVAKRVVVDGLGVDEAVELAQRLVEAPPDAKLLAPTLEGIVERNAIVVAPLLANEYLEGMIRSLDARGVTVLRIGRSELDCLGFISELYLGGADLDWARLFDFWCRWYDLDARFDKRPSPPYVFDRVRCWWREQDLARGGDSDRVEPVMVGTGQARTETSVERALRFWRELLGNEDLAADDSVLDHGGHSMSVIEFLERLEEEHGIVLSVEDVLANPTPRAMSALMDRAIPVEVAPPSETEETVAPDTRAGGHGGDDTRPFALNPMQKAILAAELLGVPDGTYNLPLAIEVRGAATVERSRSALQRALYSNAWMFRKLRTDDDADRWSSVATKNPEIEVLDLVDVDDPEQIRHVIEEFGRRPFDLRSDTLCRPFVAMCPGDAVVIGAIVHHLIADGVSLRLVLQDLLQALGATNGPAGSDEPRELDGARQLTKTGSVADDADSDPESAAFWSREVSVPRDFNTRLRAHLRSAKARRGTGKVTEDCSDLLPSVRALASSARCTSFAVVMASVLVSLSAQVDDPLPVVGMDAAVRGGRGRSPTDGNLINVFPFGLQVEPNIDFREQCMRVATKLRATLRHRAYPLASILERYRDAHARPDASVDNLFELFASYQSTVGQAALAELSGEGIEIRPYPLGPWGLRFKIELTFVEGDDDLVCVAMFDTEIYDERSVECAVLSVLETLRRGVDDPRLLVSELQQDLVAVPSRGKGATIVDAESGRA